jgi:peptidoglycan/xylan/chitin deacetylase (PgdA/CDA1 family)
VESIVRVGEIMETHSLAVTIDIEDWYHIPPVCGSSSSIYKNVGDFFRQWNWRYDYLSEPTHQVLNLLDEFGIVATFFVVANIIERYPGLIESIAERGHEIACHGLDHSTKIHPKTKEPLINKNDFYERTLKAKRILEIACRERVIGYRAPNAYISGWMLDTLRDLNFIYDSSVCMNSLYNKSDSSLKGVSTRQIGRAHV